MRAEVSFHDQLAFGKELVICASFWYINTYAKSKRILSVSKKWKFLQQKSLQIYLRRWFVPRGMTDCTDFLLHTCNCQNQQHLHHRWLRYSRLKTYKIVSKISGCAVCSFTTDRMGKCRLTWNTNSLWLLNFDVILEPAGDRDWIASYFALNTDIGSDGECIAIWQWNVRWDRFFLRNKIKLEIYYFE